MANWLKRLLGRPTGEEDAAPSDAGLVAVLDDHVLAAFDRQLAFADLVGDRDWVLDQDAGELRLGSDIVLPAQIVGTFAEERATWRWSWANPTIGEDLTQMAREAARRGKELGHAFLTDADVDRARIGGAHAIGLAVAGLLDADAYYRCPYDGGWAIVLVAVPEVRIPQRPPSSIRAAAMVTAALSSLPVAITRTAVVSYLRGLGLPVHESADEIKVDDDSGARFRFDDRGRVAEVGMRRGPTG